MTSIHFDGWEPGLDKVALNRLLREYAEMRLGEAKQAVDHIVSGETVVVAVNSNETAHVLVRESRDVGARCKIASQAGTVQPAAANGDSA